MVALYRQRAAGAKVSLLTLITILSACKSLDSHLESLSFESFQPTMVRSSLATADDSVPMISLAHPSSPGTVGRVELAAPKNLNQLELEAMRAFIDSCTAPCTTRSIVLVRYEEGIPEVSQALLDAVKKGFSEVTLITDLNVSMEATRFDSGKNYTVDFVGSTKPRDSSTAKELVRLLASPSLFSYNAKTDKRYGIFSQPVYKTGAPIMHEKELYLIDLAKPVGHQIDFYFGSSNMTGSATATANGTNSTRFNRVMKVTDDVQAKVALDHAMQLKQAFGAGKPISRITDRKPNWTRVIFADNSFAEYMFTDGLFNLNDRITKLFKNAQNSASPEDHVQINDVIYSHFVFTDIDEMEALRAAMTDQPGFSVRGIFDVSFADADGNGISPAYAGYLLGRLSKQKDFSRVAIEDYPAIKPFNSAWRSRFSELYTYQRRLPQAPNPALPWHMWHDKTTIVSVTDSSGKKWTYIFTGSFNNSSHSVNAELQVAYKVPSESGLAKQFITSVMATIDREKQPATLDATCRPDGDDGLGCAVLLELGVLRLELARLTGNTPTNVPVIAVKNIADALNAGQLDKVTNLLGTLKNSGRPDTGDKFARVTRFLTWYQSKSAGGGLSAQRFMAAMSVMQASSKQTSNPNWLKMMLGFAYSDLTAHGPLTLDELISESAPILVIVGAPDSSPPPPGEGD